MISLPAPPLGGGRNWPITGQVGDHFGQLREARKDIEIFGDFGLDAQMLDFDYDLGAVEESGEVNLTNRSRSDGLIIKFQEEAIDRLA